MFAKGEIYKIEDRQRVFKRLDHLEQAGRIYKRVRVPVTPAIVTGINKYINCWAYILLMDLPPHRLVRNGNWEMGDDVECSK